jgi:Flp pilus assembly pilin Flp
MSNHASALVPLARSVRRRSIRKSTYGYYGKLRMVDRPGDAYLHQVTSPVGGSRARDGREGGGVFLSLATRVRAFWFRLREGFEDQTGAVATEYVLLLIFIAVVIVGAATAFGLTLGDKYKEACGAFGSTCP